MTIVGRAKRWASATAEGLKLGLRYHFIGLGRLVTFALEAGVGWSYFVTDTVALNAGYRFQHISNGDTQVRAP